VATDLTRDGEHVQGPVKGKRKRARRDYPATRVYRFPEEAELLKTAAAAVGKSLSDYLLKVGLAYRPRPVLDQKRVEDLLRVNADLGRLGGVLKGWLAGHPDFGEPPDGRDRPLVRGTLMAIQETQTEMRALLQELRRLRASEGGSGGVE